MKIKKYIMVVAIVLTVGLSYAGSAFSCSDGGPPPDTNSVKNEYPTL